MEPFENDPSMMDNNPAEIEPEVSATDSAAPEAAPEEPAAQESRQEEAPQSGPVYSERPESPFANSPYTRPPYGAGAAYSPYPQPKPKKPRNGHSFWQRALAAVLTLALIAGGCLITGYTVNKNWEKRSSQNMAVMNQKIEALQKQIDAASGKTTSPIVGNAVNIEGLSPSQVYAQNVDSVVGISCKVQTASIFGQTATGTATGSGFIISEDGYVVTNKHVIENGTAIEVHTNTGNTYEAKVVGTDSINDVAVLKIDAEGLPYAVIGSSDSLAIGDMVVAIGNPLGKLTATQTVGYVSGKDREVNTDNALINMIQTDAAINSGNSGGPLFNMKGEVVGITTAKYSGTTSSGASIEGISFAIPIDDVLSVIDDLRDLGYVSGAYLGVTVTNVDSASASLYNLPVGAYVQTVVSGSAADKAGIEVKDIIIKLGSYEVTNITSLTRALRHYNAGDTEIITVVRGGQEIELSITLDERPKDLDSDAAAPDPEMPEEGDYDEWYEYFRKHFDEENDAG